MSYTTDSLDKMEARSGAQLRQNKQALKKLRLMNAGDLDRMMLREHNDEFSRIDCLECANCCKSISPSISDADVRRLAAFVKLKVPDFIDRYLKPDKDEDFVFKNIPCPFLGSDNYCSVYESRPKACREYPHTNRKRFYQILDITAQNTRVCPAVFNIIERVKNNIQV